MCFEYRDMGAVCTECDVYQGWDRHWDSLRHHAHCYELGTNHCWTEDMRNNGELKFIGMGDQCYDSCDRELMIRVPGEMRCQCAIGAHEKWRDHCDRDTEDCFDRCECPPGSNQGYSPTTAGSSASGAPSMECICDDQAMTMTWRGCRNTRDHQTDCEARETAFYDLNDDRCEM